MGRGQRVVQILDLVKLGNLRLIINLNVLCSASIEDDQELL